MAEPITRAEALEYVGGGGVVCPKCKGVNISGSSINIEASTAWQNVDCNDCGASWQDSYRLCGVYQNHEDHSYTAHDFTEAEIQGVPLA